MQLSERLLAYDNEAIGQEFSPVNVIKIDEQKRLYTRRQELLLKDWQSSLDSVRVPKSALSHTRSFETFCLRSESVLCWAATIIVSSIAGLLCAMAIRHLHLL